MPHYLWCLIKDNAEAIAAIAAAMAAIFTGLYFTYTIKIFRETKRAADAATTSATAAQQSASAANQSFRLMRQQFVEQAEVGQLVIQTTIDSAVSGITYWLEKNLNNPTFARSLPSTDSLLPFKVSSAIDHAGRVNQEGAVKLSSAFDDLRVAYAEIEYIRNLAAAYGTAIGVDSNAQRTINHLKTALVKFTEAKAILLKAAD